MSEAANLYWALRPLIAEPWLDAPVQRIGQKDNDALQRFDCVHNDADIVLKGERPVRRARVEHGRVLHAIKAAANLVAQLPRLIHRWRPQSRHPESSQE